MRFLKRLIVSNAFPLIPAFLLCEAVLIYFNERFAMQADLFLFSSALFLWLIILRTVDVLRRHPATWIIFLFLFLGILVSLAYFCLPFPGQDNDVISWWFLYNPTIGYRFDSLNAFLTMSLLTIGAGTIGYLLQKFFALRLFCGVLTIASIVLLAVFSENAPALTLFFAVGYLVLVSAELCYRTSPVQKRRIGSGSIAALLLPAALLASLITVVIPQPEKPISWQFVVDIAEDIQSKIGLTLFRYGGGVFGEKTLGYSETTDPLGGNVTTRPGNVLIISFPGGKPEGGIYIGGSVQDTYTGISWERNAVPFDGPFPENELDTIEMLHAIQETGRARQFSDSEFRTLMRGTPFILSYNDIPWTYSVFLPPKVIHVDHGKYDRLQYDITSTGARFRNLTRNADLSGYYLDINYGSPLFRTVCLENKEQRFWNPSVSALENWNGSFENWIGIPYIINTDYYSFHSPGTNLGAVMRERAKWIRENYTGLPDSLPDRVKTLTEEITAGYDNDYDRLKAIEDYLASGRYEYTLTPGSVPEGRDFVDYFLFDNPNGYCTYFATAMAVMARTIGIPTRYAQGFDARCDRWIPSMANHSYYILQEEAHTWPEAYIEGVGWIPFEPTPSRQRTRYPNWDPNAGPTVPQEEDSPYENMEGEDGQGSGPVAPEEDSAGFNGRIILAVLILLLVLLLLSVFPMILLFRRKRRKNTYAHADNKERFYLNYSVVFTILDAFRRSPFGGETLTEYAERVSAFFKFPDAPVKAAFERYAEIFYSGAEPTREDTVNSEILRGRFLNEARQNLSRIRYWRVLLRL